MKLIFGSIIIVFFFTLLSCDTEKKNPIEGTWELVSAKYIMGDSTSEYSQKDLHSIKIITKGHFAFLTQIGDRPKFTKMGNDAEMLLAARTFGAGGGTYTLEGDTYTEHIQFFLEPNFIDMSIPFKVKVEDNQLIQTGTMPLKSAGFRNQDSELYEVYKRIE
jgi:hypothetical protein